MTSARKSLVTLAVRHLPSQRDVIGAMARMAGNDWFNRPLQHRNHDGACSGPKLVERVRAPSAALVRDYVRAVGGEPGAYSANGTTTLPPHLFPQWSVPVAARALHGVPYQVTRMLNAGCRLVINAALPAQAELTVTAELVGVDDDGRRALLHQRLITATPAEPEALVAELYEIVPSVERAQRANARSSVSRPGVRVPPGAREIAVLHVGSRDGLAFSLLTGDFNPVHWSASYARAAGFERPILHGFALMARAMEALARVRYAGDVSRIAVFDVRFSRPLPLGVEVGLYLGEDGRSVFAADALGGRPYLHGSFEEKRDG
jgi:acyl dehydratase